MASERAKPKRCTARERTGGFIASAVLLIGRLVVEKSHVSVAKIPRFAGTCRLDGYRSRRLYGRAEKPLAESPGGGFFSSPFRLTVLSAAGCCLGRYQG